MEVSYFESYKLSLTLTFVRNAAIRDWRKVICLYIFAVRLVLRKPDAFLNSQVKNYKGPVA